MPEITPLRALTDEELAVIRERRDLFYDIGLTPDERETCLLGDVARLLDSAEAQTEILRGRKEGSGGQSRPRVITGPGEVREVDPKSLTAKDWNAMTRRLEKTMRQLEKAKRKPK